MYVTQGRGQHAELHLKLWTLKTAEGRKQTAHLYCWFWVTTVFLDDFGGTFSVYLRGFVLKF